MEEPLFQVKTEKESQNKGVFVIEPLEQGYGHTLGNALRRVLLTSLPGAAVTFVKIAGVRHQFTTLTGLREDLVDLILNIKKIRLKYQGKEPVKIRLEATGPGEVTAKKIKTPAKVTIANPDLVLAHLSDKKAKLSVEMTVEAGLGYSPFEERKSDVLGVIPIDAAFSPVTRVNYQVEATRVGRLTNYDRLILEVETDGTVAPLEAVKEASKTLIAYFKQVVEPKVPKKKVEEQPDVPHMTLRLTVEELNLPTRIVNALEKAGYKTVADLIAVDKKEIAKVKNLGEKCFRPEVRSRCEGKKGIV
jgi:DNA-directed RNA polymerase subunit alpha